MMAAPAAKGVIPAVPTSIATPVPTIADGVKGNAAAPGIGPPNAKCIAHASTVQKVATRSRLGRRFSVAGMMDTALPRDSTVVVIVAVPLTAMAGSVATAPVIVLQSADRTAMWRGTMMDVQVEQEGKRSKKRDTTRPHRGIIEDGGKAIATVGAYRLPLFLKTWYSFITPD